MEQKNETQFVDFDCPAVPLAEGTPAAPRPADRPRRLPVCGDVASIQFFDGDQGEQPTEQPPNGRARPGVR